MRLSHDNNRRNKCDAVFVFFSLIFSLKAGRSQKQTLFGCNAGDRSSNYLHLTHVMAVDPVAMSLGIIFRHATTKRLQLNSIVSLLFGGLVSRAKPQILNKKNFQANRR